MSSDAKVNNGVLTVKIDFDEMKELIRVGRATAKNDFASPRMLRSCHHCIRIHRTRASFVLMRCNFQRLARSSIHFRARSRRSVHAYSGTILGKLPRLCNTQKIRRVTGGSPGISNASGYSGNARKRIALGDDPWRKPKIFYCTGIILVQATFSAGFFFPLSFSSFVFLPRVAPLYQELARFNVIGYL